MTPVSRKKLDKQTSDELNSALLSSLENLNKKDLNKALTTLLTKTEVTMLNKRAGIIAMLDNNNSYDEIAELTNTTKQTIARIKLQLQVLPEETKDIVIKKLKKWYKISVFKDILKQLSEVNSPSRAIRNKARKVAGL